jgi:hypothetical protein
VWCLKGRPVKIGLFPKNAEVECRLTKPQSGSPLIYSILLFCGRNDDRTAKGHFLIDRVAALRAKRVVRDAWPNRDGRPPHCAEPGRKEIDSRPTHRPGRSGSPDRSMPARCVAGPAERERWLLCGRSFFLLRGEVTSRGGCCKATILRPLIPATWYPGSGVGP